MLPLEDKDEEFDSSKGSDREEQKEGSTSLSKERTASAPKVLEK